MENVDKSPYYFNEEVKIVAYCPFCEADLNPIKARIVETSDEMNLVHFQCNKCKGLVLALVLKTSNGLSSVGLITDLTYQDVFRFKNKTQLDSDDVLNIYQVFQQKDIIKQIKSITK